MKTCCIDGCACECENGRRYCREHYLQRKREQTRLRYKQFGRSTMYKHVCSVCGTEYITTRKKSCGVCKKCVRETYESINNQVNAYSYKTSTSCGIDAWAHRVLAKQYYGNEIPPGYDVHHIDCVRTNNTPDNLVLIRSSDHARLHAIALVKYAPIRENVSYFDFMREFFKQFVEEHDIEVIRLV